MFSFNNSLTCLDLSGQSVILFPGQGMQFVGMGKKVLGNSQFCVCGYVFVSTGVLISYIDFLRNINQMENYTLKNWQNTP